MLAHAQIHENEIHDGPRGGRHQGEDDKEVVPPRRPDDAEADVEAEEGAQPGQHLQLLLARYIGQMCNRHTVKEMVKPMAAGRWLKTGMASPGAKSEASSSRKCRSFMASQAGTWTC